MFLLSQQFTIDNPKKLIPTKYFKLHHTNTQKMDNITKFIIVVLSLFK